MSPEHRLQSPELTLLCSYFICGMVFAGAGAGINELTALAATSELAPTAQRGKYVAVLIFTILPFLPSVLYGQLIAYYTSWRWLGLICAIWAFLGLVMIAVFYFPPPRVNSEGMSTKEVLAEIDYVGGILSVGGMILFLAGMQWGKYTDPLLAVCCANVVATRWIPVSLG